MSVRRSRTINLRAPSGLRMRASQLPPLSPPRHVPFAKCFAVQNGRRCVQSAAAILADKSGFLVTRVCHARLRPPSTTTGIMSRRGGEYATLQKKNQQHSSPSRVTTASISLDDDGSLSAVGLLIRSSHSLMKVSSPPPSTTGD